MDHYIDDAILVVGVGVFLDWMQHTVQGQEIVAWAKTSGAEKFAQGDPEWEAIMKKATSQLKALLQKNQSQAAGYFNALSGQARASFSQRRLKGSNHDHGKRYRARAR